MISMAGKEFIDVLQKSLAGNICSSSVNENIRYYQEYFDAQTRMGRSEEEIAGELGDPRLLAKTIIEAGKYEGRSNARPEYDEVYEDGSGEDGNVRSKVYRMPGWLTAALVILAVVMVLGIVGSIVSALLPVIIPVVCVILLLRFFQRRN